MRMFSQLIGKVGLVTVGVGVGLVIAAGGGVAAIHYSQVASDHSISAQPATVVDDRGGLRTTGSDDVASASSPSAAGSHEPEPGDDSRSRTSSSAQPSATATRGNGTPDDGTHRESSRTPEPGDDHGKDGAR